MLYDSSKPVNVKIQNDSFILYQPNYLGCKVSDLRNYKLSLVRNKGYNGYLNRTAIRRIKNTLSNWYTTLNEFNNSSEGRKSYYRRKLVFITLTLSSEQIHDDKFVKRHFLDRFIVQMKRTRSMNNYLWKAEKQQNGNIHFHVVTDIFIDKKYVQQVWNDIQNDYGYIDRFFLKFNHTNPPSTDIHQVNDLKQLGSYVSKYLTKNDKENQDEKLIVKGRLYGVSDGLRKLKSFTCDTPYDLICYLNDSANRLVNRVFESDYFDIYTCDTSLILDSFFPSISVQRSKFYVNEYKKLYFISRSEKPSQNYATPLIHDWQPKQLHLDFNLPDPYIDNHYFD